MLGASVGGRPVETVLVEEVVDAEAELYVGLAADGSEALPTLVLSHRGGQDVERIPDDHVASVEISPLVGLQPYHVRTAARELVRADSRAEVVPVDALSALATALWTVFVESDLRLLEINPMGVVDEGVVAMDAKLVLDGAADFRHERPDVHSSLTDLERAAEERGLELKEGDGLVAVMANGAGIGLSTVDLLAEAGGETLAAFIDTHGPQFSVEQTRECLELLARSNAAVVVVNMVTPFLDSSQVAEQLAAAVADGYELPVVARFKGLGAERAIETCTDAGIVTAREVPEAVQRANELLAEAK
jgi:succinyl-CoA synthetase beta subunit